MKHVTVTMALVGLAYVMCKFLLVDAGPSPASVVDIPYTPAQINVPIFSPNDRADLANELGRMGDCIIALAEDIKKCDALPSQEDARNTDLAIQNNNCGAQKLRVAAAMPDQKLVDELTEMDEIIIAVIEDTRKCKAVRKDEFARNTELDSQLQNCRTQKMRSAGVRSARQLKEELKETDQIVVAVTESIKKCVAVRGQESARNEDLEEQLKNCKRQQRRLTAASWRMTHFPIGALPGPHLTEAEYADYAACGFNTVLSYRDSNNVNPNLNHRNVNETFRLSATTEPPLWVVIDTYTNNKAPWGYVAPAAFAQHPLHHPATKPELEWLTHTFGKMPYLAGFYLGDDLPCELMTPNQHAVIESVDFLQATFPDLFPILDFTYNLREHDAHECFHTPDCIKAASENLNLAGAPIHSMELYPLKGGTLQNRQASLLEDLRQLAGSSKENSLLTWPILDLQSHENDGNRWFPQDSAWVRFQAYACIAYGAHGLWYFDYAEDGRGIAVAQKSPLPPTRIKPLWDDVKQINTTIKACGSLLLTHHFERAIESRANQLNDSLVKKLNDDMMVGVLEPDSPTDPSALVVIVDCRLTGGKKDAIVCLSNDIANAEEKSGQGAEFDASGHKLILKDLIPGGARVVKLTRAAH